MKKVITAQDISEARKAGAATLSVPAKALVTPQAQDDARSYGITLRRESAFANDAKTHHAGRALPEPPLATTAPTAGTALLAGTTQLQRFANIAQERTAHAVPARMAGGIRGAAPERPLAGPSLLEAVRAEVSARLGRVADTERVNNVIADVMVEMSSLPNSGMAPENAPVPNGADAMLVRSVDFPKGAGASRSPGNILLTDVVAPGPDGPGMGFLEFSAGSFEFAFAAHEVLTVLEGALVVTVQGHSLRADLGDAVRVSAGTRATLSSEGYVRCLYNLWPG